MWLEMISTTTGRAFGGRSCARAFSRPSICPRSLSSTLNALTYTRVHMHEAPKSMYFVQNIAFVGFRFDRQCLNMSFIMFLHLLTGLPTCPISHTSCDAYLSVVTDFKPYTRLTKEHSRAANCDFCGAYMSVIIHTLLDIHQGAQSAKWHLHLSCEQLRCRFVVILCCTTEPRHAMLHTWACAL